MIKYTRQTRNMALGPHRVRSAECGVRSAECGVRNDTTPYVDKICRQVIIFKKPLTKHKTSVIITFANATMAQLVEHILGKDEVIGSIPISSSSKKTLCVHKVFFALFNRYALGKISRMVDIAAA